MKQYKNVNELWGAIVNGDMDPSVSDFFVTGASYIYQTTQFPNSINKYHNYYLLLRVGTYFGACSHVPEQLGIEAGREFSGKSLKSCVIDPRLPLILAQYILTKGNAAMLWNYRGEPRPRKRIFVTT